MSVPHHVQIYFKRDSIFRGFFYRRLDGRFALFLKNEDTDVTQDGGEWPSLGDADEWARLLIEEATASGAEVAVDPLCKYRGHEYQLLVTRDSLDHRWAVIAGNRKSGRFEDTRARFDSREEARSAIDANAGHV